MARFVGRRARPSGIVLDETDAASVKGMLLRGDRQHDIAAWFGVNGGRVAEVASGDAFDWVVPAPDGDLPPPGPYPAARLLTATVVALVGAQAALAAAQSLLKPTAA
jgi:hypothetical protein